MDSYWESQTLNNIDEDDILLPLTNEPVTMLGKQYSALYDREEIRSDIVSRIWCTYRRGFAPIGGVSGFTSDAGWGCMHRCGQMMLAQALVMIHLGRNWRWFKGIDDKDYQKILTLFHDSKKCLYSIHMISSMGQEEGKQIGKWFGPNTVAQVLNKLSRKEKWTNLIFHITMEDGIIIDEIVSKCKRKVKQKDNPANNKSAKLSTMSPHSQEIDDNCVEIVIPPTAETQTTNEYTKMEPNLQRQSSVTEGWKPLLLIIPVRLGLNELNHCYIPALKDIFQLPYTVGILGGRPSHALWFIGHLGDDLIYLDPHESQSLAPMTTKLNRNNNVPHNSTSSQILNHYSKQKYSSAFDSFISDDSSYHCTKWGRMSLSKLDPSLALGFVVTSEDDLLDLCEQLKKRILLPAGDHPMFEIHQKRPYYFPPITTSIVHNAPANNKSNFINIKETKESDDEFELL